MKRTALTRRASLRRTTLSPAAPKHTRRQPNRRPAGIPAKVRAALRQRSGGVCEIQAGGCEGRATEASHRLGVKMGGRHGAAAARHHVLSQMLHACRGCHHSVIHAYPAAAYWRGWMLREHENPRAVPVLYRGVWSLLDDSGGVTHTNLTTADMPNAEEA